jgi:hypothetical protein
MNKNNKISFVIAIIILLFILILFFTLRFEKNADVKNVSILDCKTCQDIQTRTATEKLKLSEITEYLYSGEINKTHAINLLTEVEKRIDSINSIIRKELPSFRLLTFSELLDAQSILKNDTTDFDKKNLLSLEYALVADGDLLSEILKIDDEYTKIKESFFKGDIKHDEAVNHILEREGIPHKVLNAKHHEQEGEIIAQAGKKGAVTIATNMAGRGVDISLGGVQASPEESEEVKKLGGLCVIGTERHEARRIDNQLRGRAGRQGDPGETQFFVSLEDDVIRIFGGDKIKALMERFNIDEDTPIENALISRSIESAQNKIEGFNFDSRKHVLEYDDVLNKQRNTIYSKRDEILGRENLRDMIVPLLSKYGYSENDYNRKEKEVGEENMRQIEKIAGIRAIDSIWIEHLENMESLKDSVRLRAYGQRDPLVEYKKEGHRLFKELLENCERNMVESIMKATINIQPLSKPEEYSTPKNKTGISRNDPCPCGSGKKYKKCCGK